MKILVVQKGAREHYAVARALQQQGLLAGLVTDWYAFGGRRVQVARSQKSEVRSQTSDHRPLSSVVRLLSSVVRSPSALAARCEEIPDALVYGFPFRSLLWKWRGRRLAAEGRRYEAYRQTDSAFATAVARLKLPSHEVFFGYSYASLEILAAEKKRGVLTVLDQIDPGAVEFRLVAEEMARYPELAGPPPELPAAYYECNRREWDLADIIVVNSEWSRDALISEGADPAKIDILPLAFEAEDGGRKSEVRSQTSDLRPLKVLWLGQVNVRKGIHYLIEAARLLEGENVQFDIVGAIGISEAAVKLVPHKVRFHGPISRDRAAEWYRQSDVFVLPTLSDGFALTQLEAMAHGVPVITTPNCGRVVEEGKTGFIIPARDGRALADAILKFATDRNLSEVMAPACREAVKVYSVGTYGKRLAGIIEKHIMRRNSQ